jgi:hypothetical protein
MLTCLVLAASISTAAVGGTWAVAPLEGVNVHPGYVAAGQQILKGHLEAIGQPFVVLDDGVADPAAAAKQKGASAVLRCSMTRIGQKVKVWLRLQPLDGAPRTVTLDAGSPEDLDPVLLRLTRHLVQGAPTADAHIGEVTERESLQYGRKAAASYFGLSVTGTFGGTSGGGEGLGGFGLYWLYDARTFLADIQAGFGVSQGSSDGGGWAGLTLAGLYPLSDRDFTPFVGGGLGFMQLELDHRSGTGVQIFGDVGFLVGRTSTVHFRADLKPFITTFKLTGLDTTGGSLAYGAQIALGIGY